MEFELKIEKFFYFQNQRIHGIFNDNTSIIIHPGFGYFTFFDSLNNKMRFKIFSLLPLFSGIKQKFELICDIYNKFTFNFFVDYHNNERNSCQNLNKELTFYWIYSKEYFSETNEYFSIKSYEDKENFCSHCQFYLFKCLKIVKIVFFKDNKSFLTKMLFVNNDLPDDEFISIPLNFKSKFFKIALNLKNCQKNEKNSKITENESKTTFSLQISNTSPKIWENDNINPLVHPYLDSSNIKFMLSSDYLFNLTQNDKELEIFKLNEENKSFMYTINNINELIIQKNNECIIIDSYLKALENDENNEFEFFEIISQINELKKFIKDSIKHSNNIAKINSKNDENSLIKEVHQEFNKEIGKFSAFSNKTIKIFFNNRTILKMNKNYEVEIIDNKGNLIFLNEFNNKPFQKYFLIAKNYFLSVFDKEKHLDQQIQLKEMKQLIESNLKRNEILNKISLNKINNLSNYNDITNQNEELEDQNDQDDELNQFVPFNLQNLIEKYPTPP